jgi:transposase InsO family protein
MVPPVREKGKTGDAALRYNNGPEFISRHFLTWCLERGIELVHIERASRCRMRTWKVFMEDCEKSV